ncbi:hypothetical protein [Desulfitobacterium hafniense]|uniref:DUF3800 domain-containing protein n=3 Tax=Desulfitobacterium hafniense TaxID=49338 RepID=Q24Z38_DESHY|nr:hypothetical protein [Desulfitobacterium hafniense]ACL20041.1 hypothetical protein Dhaf_2004 [Desulfitobacterium hafniense DCB-2]KTE91732.1 hypothetical protein AT727_21045 [Desulfitobacterium hafniense]BAE82704.1 hypothetical protein DSY0915 [Desulfitobacterium hafniense Y51]
MKQQISLDDLNRAEVNDQPGRTAFIKEWGDFGFDFGQEGTSKFYIVCAVIVANSAIPQLEKSLEKIGFTEEEQLRVKVLNELLPLDFNLIFLIADKGRFFRDVPVPNFKGVFVKHLYDQLYKNLYHAYPKLQIAEEPTGRSEFQAGFKDYVGRERPVQNLFDQYDFDFVAGRHSGPAQLAEWLGGTVSKQLHGENTGDYLNILYWKILNIEKIPGDNAVNLNPAADNSRFNQEIANLAFRKARGYIREHERDAELEKRLQVSFLKYLIFEAQYGNPYKFITSKQILSVLSKYADTRLSKDFLYRKIVAPLRDARVVLASSPQGYKLPISVEDISAYLQQTNSIIAPMLHRMGLCREVILQQTGGKLDVLAEDEFLKYQKYFD